MATDTKLMTAEELLAMPRGAARHELIQGELIEMSPTSFPHGVLTSFINAKLGSFILDHRLGVTLSGEPGFQLTWGPDTVRAPDVAFLSHERVRRRGTGAFAAVAPDLAVEVKSPTDSLRGCEEKARMWIEYDVREVWLVNSEHRLVVVFTGTDRRELRPGDTLASDLLPGFRLPVADIFAVLDEL